MSKKDRDFIRARWLWFAGAGGAMITYLLASGLVRFEYDSEEEEEEEEEEQEEEKAERGSVEAEEVIVVVDDADEVE